MTGLRAQLARAEQEAKQATAKAKQLESQSLQASGGAEQAVSGGYVKWATLGAVGGALAGGAATVAFGFM